MRCEECGGEVAPMASHDAWDCVLVYRERVRKADARVAELEGSAAPPKHTCPTLKRRQHYWGDERVPPWPSCEACQVGHRTNETVPTYADDPELDSALDERIANLEASLGRLKAARDRRRGEGPIEVLPYAPEGVDVSVILLGAINACDTNAERREVISEALHNAHRLGMGQRTEPARSEDEARLVLTHAHARALLGRLDDDPDHRIDNDLELETCANLRAFVRGVPSARAPSTDECESIPRKTIDDALTALEEGVQDLPLEGPYTTDDARELIFHAFLHVRAVLGLAHDPPECPLCGKTEQHVHDI